ALDVFPDLFSEAGIQRRAGRSHDRLYGGTLQFREIRKSAEYGAAPLAAEVLMRVLHVDSGKEMRGGQWQVLALLRGLGSGNLLLTPEGGPLMTQARSSGLEVEPLTMLSLGALARKFDIVHAHDARSHTWAAA